MKRPFAATILLLSTASAFVAEPAGFESAMNPQQIADHTAYLLAQKAPAQDIGRSKAVGFSFEETDSKLRLFLGRQSITTYLKSHPHLTRRAFVHVRTPSGIRVTRKFPAPEGSDHLYMHPGIWMGFGWLEGNDYWRLQANVVHDGYVAAPKADKDEATFAVRNRYLSADGAQTVCFETCRYRFTRRPEGLLLEWDSTFQSDQHDFRFGDQEESGLAIRVSAPIRVQGGNGTILNDRGQKNGKETWGQPMKWIDYSGVIDGKRVGLLVMPHPGNPRPSWSHSRDYGVIVANPFPKQPKERRQPYITTPIRKGEPFRLRYGVLIHESEPGKAINPEVVFQEYSSNNRSRNL